MTEAWGPTTTAIHAGRRFNPTRAVTTPIFQTSVFQLMENREGAEFAASIEPPAFYTRWGNPNASEALEVITRGVSLGGVESLIQHPASMSHLKTAPDVKASLGISDGLLRFSVGIEDQPDLAADLERGFQAAMEVR